MGISKGTVQITRDKDSTIVVIKGKDGGRARYRYKNQDEYLAPFLHVENLRYYVARRRKMKKTTICFIMPFKKTER